MISHCEHDLDSMQNHRPTSGSPEFANALLAAVRELQTAIATSDRRRIIEALFALWEAAGIPTNRSSPIRMA